MAMKTNGYTEGRAKQNTSLSSQQTDSNLRAVKTYSKIESRVGRREDSWEAMNGDAKGFNQKGTSAPSGQTLV